MSIYPESVSRLRRLALADRVVGMGGWGGWRGSEYIYIYPESVSRLRRLALVESGWDGGMEGQ